MDKKVAIVTGGSGGIGEAIVRAFIREGASVLISDIKDTKGQALAEELGKRAIYLRTDVTDAASVKRMVDTATDRFGHLDVLVNNAGYLSAPASVIEYSEEEFDRSIAVNLKGPWLCFKYAFLALCRQRGSSVINIASIAAMIGNPAQTGYGAAKGGLAQLTRHCAVEISEAGGRVNTISPGGIVTEMSMVTRPGWSRDQVAQANADRNPLRRTGWPEDIAHAAVWLASDEAAHVTGQNIVIDAGVSTLHLRT